MRKLILTAALAAFAFSGEASAQAIDRMDTSWRRLIENDPFDDEKKRFSIIAKRGDYEMQVSCEYNDVVNIIYAIPEVMSMETIEAMQREGQENNKMILR